MGDDLCFHGNPHAVVWCDDVDGLEIEKIGPLFEHHEMFPDRTNTEFVKVLDRHNVQMRVWERGAGETLACGTGRLAPRLMPLGGTGCATGT